MGSGYSASRVQAKSRHGTSGSLSSPAAPVAAVLRAGQDRAADRRGHRGPRHKQVRGVPEISGGRGRTRRHAHLWGLHTHTHSLCVHTQTLPLSTSKGPTWVSGLEFHPLRLGPSHAHSDTRRGRSPGPGPGWGAQQCRSAGAGSSQGPESLEKEGGKRKRDREDPEVTGAEARGRGHVGSAVRGATWEAASHPQARDGTAVLRRGRRWPSQEGLRSGPGG